jgi:hypothetical protein
MSAIQDDTTRKDKDRAHPLVTICLPPSPPLLSESSLASVSDKRTEERPSPDLLKGTSRIQSSPKYTSKLFEAKIEEERDKRGLSGAVDDPPARIEANDMGA